MWGNQDLNLRPAGYESAVPSLGHSGKHSFLTAPNCRDLSLLVVRHWSTNGSREPNLLSFPFAWTRTGRIYGRKGSGSKTHLQEKLKLKKYF